MFRIIWVHLGLFGCVTTLSLKRVKLMQKFVTRSRVGIFLNERTRSTPLDPKLMILCVSSVWVHLAMFRYYTKLSAKQAELVQLM